METQSAPVSHRNTSNQAGAFAPEQAMTALSAPPAESPHGGVSAAPPEAYPPRPVRQWLSVVLGLVLVVYLGGIGLDHAAFWDDEAHVALMAKNFLATGRLTAWDGRNLHAYRNGIVLDAQLRQLGPPLDSVVTAGAFYVFGPSTWSGRLPFVIAGVLGLGVFTLLLRHDFGTATPVWLYALGVLALAPGFLLNIRQCRYYALAVLLSQIAFYTYRRAVTTRQLRYFMLLGGSCALLFYSSYLLCIAFLLALAVVHLGFYGRPYRMREWAKVACAISVFACMTLPYMDRMLYYPDLGQGGGWLPRRATLLWWNLRDLNVLGYLPWPMALGLAGVLLRPRLAPGVRRTAAAWSTLCLVYIAGIALLSPQPTGQPTIADVRYLIIAVPFLAGLMGIVLWSIHRHMPAVAIAVAAVLVLCNALTLTPWQGQFRWLLPAYLGEIHRPYPTSYEAVARFLNQHATYDDLVLTLPEYTHPPLLFYAGAHIRVCCLIDRRTPLPAATLQALPAPVFLEQHFPHWVVAFGNTPAVWQALQYFSRPHQQEGIQHQYTYTFIAALDVFWGATQRPELPWHRFYPRTDFDRRTEAVYIFQRRTTTP